MGSFSNYLENELLDHVFGASAYSAPATLYVGLSTADPLDDGSGIAEPVGGSYARKDVTNNKTNWTVASSGALSNAVAITFVQATARWGVITHFFVSDALSGGNMLGHGTLTASKTIDNGDTLSFLIGDLDITLD